MVRDIDCTVHTPVTWGRRAEPVYGKGVEIRPHVPGKNKTEYERKSYLEKLLPLEDYDLIVVLFSGGKDCSAAFFHLLELGVPKEKIQLWHHDVDGKNPLRQMDWPVTQPYVRAFAKINEVELRPSWRVGGFFGELYRVGASYPIEYEDNGQIITCPLSPKQIESERLREEILAGLQVDDEALKQYGYRMKFPAKSADLARRWCSAYLKIGVSDTVIRNLDELKLMGQVEQFPRKGSIAVGRWCSPQLKREVGDSVIRNLDALKQFGSNRHKFPAKTSPQQGRWCSGALKAQVESGVIPDLSVTKKNTKILVVSGERRGESKNRAGYNEMEVHRANATAKARRLVHHWRPVIEFSERDVWEVLKRHGCVPHPCYMAGWQRCSCAMCIFGLPQHWAGIRELFPDRYAAIRQDEEILNFTIDNNKNLDEYVGGAESCVNHDAPKAVKQLVTGIFSVNDILVHPDLWLFPAGAFHGQAGGPC